MAAIHCIQALGFPSRIHLFFRIGEQNRYNIINKKQRGLLVFASADKNPVKEIYNKSKRLLHVWKIEERRKFGEWGSHSSFNPLESLHRCPITCIRLLFELHLDSTCQFFPCTCSSQVETLLDSVKWDDKGLAVGIAQNIDTGAVLMQGFVNRVALATTVSSKKATFYSRSRSALWTKGETSKNFIHVHDIYLDCDRDSIIYLGKPDGPTCHTGAETCYYTSVSALLENEQEEENKLALTTLYSLETTISKRKDELTLPQTGKPSWTKRLLLDHDLLCSKIREEADELCRTLEENEDKARTASEMGDVLYHAMVLMAVKGVKIEEVLEVLRKRFSESGIEEKRSRGQAR